MIINGIARIEPHEFINGDVKKSPRVSFLKRDLEKHASCDSIVNLLDSSIQRQEYNYELISSQNTIIMREKLHDLLETPNKKRQKHRSSDIQVFKIRDSSTESVKCANESVYSKKSLSDVLDTDNEASKNKKKHKYHGMSDSLEYVDASDKKHRKKNFSSETSLELSKNVLFKNEEMPEKHKKKKKKHKHQTNEEFSAYISSDLEYVGKKKSKHKNSGDFSADVGDWYKHKKRHKNLSVSEDSCYVKEDTDVEIVKEHKKSKKRHKESSLSEAESYKNDESFLMHSKEVSERKKSKKRDKNSSISEVDSKDAEELNRKYKDLSVMQNEEGKLELEDDLHIKAKETYVNIVKKHKKSKKRHKESSLSEAESHKNYADVSEHKQSRSILDAEELNRKYKDLSVMQMEEGELELVTDYAKEINEKIDKNDSESHKIKKKKKHKKTKDDRNDSYKSKLTNQFIEVPKKDTDNDIPKEAKKKKSLSSIRNEDIQGVNKIKLDDSIENALHNRLDRLCGKLTSSTDALKENNDEAISEKKRDSEANQSVEENKEDSSASETSNKTDSNTDEKCKPKHIIKYKIKHKKSLLKPIEPEENVDSGNDNSILERINESLASLQDTMVDDSELEALIKLEIMEPWTIPPAHQIETRVSSNPTKEQQQMFTDLMIQLKTGPYTKEEDTKIKENWLQFCKDHQLQPKPMLFFPQNRAARNILPAQQRIKFARCLGNGIGNRTLYSIYCRFIKLFRGTKKGRFTVEEDNVILTYSQHADIPNRFSVLAAILNRSRDYVKKRFDVLTKTDARVNWSLDQMQELVRNILDVTKIESIHELREFNIEMKHWKEIASKMDIPAQKLQSKWTLDMYPRLFMEAEGLMSVRRKLIQKLFDGADTDRRRVNWNELAEDFPGITGAKLNKIFTELMRQYVPQVLKEDFRTCLSFLKDVIDNLPDEQINLNVTRLVYINDVLREEKTRKKIKRRRVKNY